MICDVSVGVGDGWVKHGVSRGKGKPTESKVLACCFNNQPTDEEHAGIKDEAEKTEGSRRCTHGRRGVGGCIGWLFVR